MMLSLSLDVASDNRHLMIGDAERGIARLPSKPTEPAEWTGDPSRCRHEGDLPLRCALDLIHQVRHAQRARDCREEVNVIGHSAERDHLRPKLRRFCMDES